MKLFKNKKKLYNELKNINNISFVPTMGGLHKGHEALIKASIKKSKNTIVSIFVNPRQFNDRKDFKNYPRNLNKDIDSLGSLLKFINIFLMPILLTIFIIAFSTYRKKQRSK